jgi:hypothetical protein
MRIADVSRFSGAALALSLFSALALHINAAPNRIASDHLCLAIIFRFPIMGAMRCIGRAYPQRKISCALRKATKYCSLLELRAWSRGKVSNEGRSTYFFRLTLRTG